MKIKHILSDKCDQILTVSLCTLKRVLNIGQTPEYPTLYPVKIKGLSLPHSGYSSIWASHLPSLCPLIEYSGSEFGD